MKIHRFSSILGIAMLSNVCFAQTVSDVRFEQVNNKVKITYSLDKQADISVCVSEDGGKIWSSPLKQVSGDVGTQVQPGSKTIWWDALSEYDQLVGTGICFKVTLQNRENLTFKANWKTFTMVYVQGGTFTMGATTEQGRDARDHEKPAHQVTLSDYYIGEYEVTQELWSAVMGERCSQNCSYPVSGITWWQCLDFINRLNNLLSYQLDGKRFALPTEAQWEYAARGGQYSQHYKYAGSNDLFSVAWWGSNSTISINNVKTPHSVGQKAPNELGLYDMSGNVREWCRDWYGAYSDAARTNPHGAPFGPRRVLRGGCYSSRAEDCRISSRSNSVPSLDWNDTGFRLVLLP